jgi:hypothetical protein
MDIKLPRILATEDSRDNTTGRVKEEATGAALEDKVGLNSISSSES